MSLPPRYPLTEQKSITNPLRPLHAHPFPVLANPLHHAEPLTLAPSAAMIMTNIHDHHVTHPVMTHHSSVSGSSLQEIGVPNMEARGDTAATDDLP